MQNGRASYRLYIGTCYVIVPATAMQLYVYYNNSFKRRPVKPGRCSCTTITYGSDQTVGDKNNVS